MDNELTSNRHSRSGRNFSINIDIDNDIQELNNSDETSNTTDEIKWSKHSSCLGICAFAVFTGIVMTAGIMIVCFTSPKHTNKTCELTFTPIAQRTNGYDSRPHHVAVGDFNNDMHLDIVVANSGTDSIGIFLGYGNTTFASQITYSTGLGSRPYSVAVGHFNDDTLLDIVVANYGTNNIGVFLANGNGTFASPILTSLGSSHPLSIAVNDFNKDNHSDIAVTNYGTLTVAILLGFNNGSFRIDTIYDMGYDSIPYSLVIADFNHDNYSDIAAVNYGTSELAILLLNENQSFVIQKYSTGISSHPCSIAVGDFNMDNKLDIVVTNADTSDIGIFLGYGNGSFTNFISYSTGFPSRPSFVTVVDFNNDNKLDLVVIDSENNNVIILKGYGNGSFSILTVHSSGFNSDPSSVAMGDFDHDNISDIVITNNNTNTILLLFQYSLYLAANQRTYQTGAYSNPNFVAVGDLNNDHLLDIIVANSGDDNVGIFLNLGNGIFGYQQTYYTLANSSTKFVAVHDVNNDKQLDIIVVMSARSEIGILFGYGDGTFSDGSTISTGNDAYPEFIAVADLNKDNNLDIVVPNYYAGNIMILFGHGDGTFTSGPTYFTDLNFYPEFVAVGDLNNDQILDIVAANYWNGGLGILLGYGNESFGIPIFISTDLDYPQCVTLGDLNNDHHLDIVYSNPIFSNVGVLLGYGNGTFTNITRYPTERGSYPWCVILADFNNDILLDMATSNAYDATISLFFGLGNGSFSEQKIFSVTHGYLPYSLASGDFNNDNQTDIVVSNYGNNNIEVLLFYYEEDFAQEESYLTGSGSHPYSVIINDFNNNNQSDMVIANSGTDNIEIDLNYNQETFMSKRTYSTGSGSHPQDVVTADFNKDSQLDIAVANSWGNNINVLLGFGNGTFDQASVHSTGFASAPTSMAVGDFNNDTWMDIVVANSGRNNVGVFLGFDYATFSNQTIYIPGGIATPFYLAVADFNNDHQWDIAVANRDISNIGIYLGHGDGTFSNQITYGTGYSSSPVSLAVGDFNNDNQSDIAVANSGNNNIGIFLGYGNGSFQNQITYWIGYSTTPVSLALADFNNDNQLDIVVANTDSDDVRVYLGYGNGTFAWPIIYWLAIGSSPSWVVVGDINNDTIPDIAVANFNDDNVGILLGYGNGSFEMITALLTGYYSGPWSIALADLNKDKFLDLAVANRDAQNVQVFFGYGNGTFSLNATYATGLQSYLNSIFVGDVNNDTVLDIVITDNGDGNGNIGVLYGFGNGKFTVPTIYSTGLNSQPISIVICDFNNDHRADLAVSNSNKDTIGIMLRYQTESFATQTIFSTGNNSRPTAVTVGHFNNDHHLDIAVANTDANNIGILLGHGDGNFTDQFIYTTGNNSGPCSLAVGDLNNDHHLDIVVVNSRVNTIAIFFGDGNGNFSDSKIYSTGIGSDPSSVAIDDLNKDTHLDLVIANWGTNNILVFLGLGNGTFSELKSYSLGYNARPQFIAIGDINNDNALDIAVANFGSDYVEILLQTC